MKNEIKTKNGITKLIVNSYTYGKVETIIDEDDVEKIQKYIWRAVKHYHKKTYTFATGQNVEMKLLHRYVMNCPENLQVDHINRNPLDNRKCNLRCVTAYENTANRSNTLAKQSGEKYISWNQFLNKWVVRIYKNRNQYYLGCREKLEDAIALRDSNL